VRSRSHRIAVDGLVVEVVRKDIKHLHLRVYPPDGKVKVSAPLRARDRDVRAFVASKLAWIHRTRRQIADRPRRQPRRFVSGESHYYQGKRYRLQVTYQPGSPSVDIGGQNTIEMVVRPGTDTAARERVLVEWYRARLKEAMPAIVAKWEAATGLNVAEWRVKRMKTRWGSCNVKARRIWVNLELAKRPACCLEYVILHEMVHLLERSHGVQFKALMDRFLPQWRSRRRELNRVPIGY
jgi:predicted metal-dependent hydrolase